MAQEGGLGLKQGMIAGMAQRPLIEVGTTVCKDRTEVRDDSRDGSAVRALDL